MDMPCPRIRAYPKETVVSEKLQAMVDLGMVNSRMKDYYDVWIISKQFSFEGAILSRAIQATFERRMTPIPKDIPQALSDEFAASPEKATQWRAFLKRSQLTDQEVKLSLVIRELRGFLLPPLRAVAPGQPFSLLWEPGVGWAHIVLP